MRISLYVSATVVALCGQSNALKVRDIYKEYGQLAQLDTYAYQGYGFGSYGSD